MQDHFEEIESGGGLISTLFAGLVGSLLPRLLGSNGLYRAKPKRRCKLIMVSNTVLVQLVASYAIN